MLPNLIIIGAMKAATSSLHYYLDAHPSVSMSSPKELDYFVAEGPGTWHRGQQWYESHFRSTVVRGESSPNYTKRALFPGVPERMHSIIPDVKLIYILRDPIDRMLSHYVHNVSRGAERRPVHEALGGDLGQNHYVQCSRYFEQLSPYLDFFRATNILVLTLEDLRGNAAGVMTRAFEFVGLPPSADANSRLTTVKHSSRLKGPPTAVGRLASRTLPARVVRLGRRAPILGRALYTPTPTPVPDPEHRKRLAAALADDVAALRGHTGERYESWKV